MGFLHRTESDLFFFPLAFKNFFLRAYQIIQKKISSYLLTIFKLDWIYKMDRKRIHVLYPHQGPQAKQSTIEKDCMDIWREKSGDHGRFGKTGLNI